jgi:hypothetical protein
MREQKARSFSFTTRSNFTRKLSILRHCLCEWAGGFHNLVNNSGHFGVINIQVYEINYLPQKLIQSNNDQ